MLRDAVFEHILFLDDNFHICISLVIFDRDQLNHTVQATAIYQNRPFSLHLDFWKSNLRKISGPANLDCFSVCHLDFGQIYSTNLAFFLEKKSRFAGPENFPKFKTDLDFSRPWFSEIKAQIKSPNVLKTTSMNNSRHWRQ